MQTPATSEQPTRNRVTETQLRTALTEHDGNATRAAEALGISRQHVYKLLAKWRIQVRRTVELS